MRGFVFAVAVVAVGLSVPAEARADEVGGRPTSLVVGDMSTIVLHSATRRLQRVHRGDWEQPDLLVLGYSAAWHDTLRSVLAAAQGRVETVLLIPADNDMEMVLEWLAEEGFDGPDVHPLPLELNSPWVRDFGPQQVTDAAGEAVWLNTFYSPERPADDALPDTLGRILDVSVQTVDDELQGGELISDGRGLCVTTAAHLVQASADSDDDALLARFGCAGLVVVPALQHEPTQHVDMMAQFLDATTIAVGQDQAQPESENAKRLDELVEAVELAASKLGRALRVVRVPFFGGEGATFIAYVNGLHLPGMFLVPSYSEAPLGAEDAALTALSAGLPDVAVLPIDVDEVSSGAGALHCLSLGIWLPTEGASRGALP